MNSLQGYGLPASYDVDRQYHGQQGFLPDQNADPNSPELFKHNLHLVQQQTLRLKELARRALAGIKNAYHVGCNPSQTQEDIEAVKQTLAVLSDLMRQTGIGALPLLPSDSSGHVQVPTEDQLMEKASSGVRVGFEQLKRAQESAVVVANLLGPEHRSRAP